MHRSGAISCLPTMRFAATPSRSKSGDSVSSASTTTARATPWEGARIRTGSLRGWPASLTPFSLLRDAGLKWVALAGMRSGALLASAAAEKDGSIDALVLIDPTLSGRSFVSEQRAIAAMSLGVNAKRDDGSVETPGVVYDAADGGRPEEAPDRNRTTGCLREDGLVLTRRGTSVDEGLADASRSGLGRMG